MRSSLPFVLGLAVLVGCGLATAAPPDATAAMPRMQAIAPIFSQLVAWNMPQGFRAANEQTRRNFYLLEASFHDESLDDWSQLITLTGHADAAENPDLTPELFAARLAAGFRRDCPQSFNAQPLEAPPVDDYETYAAIISCGEAMPGTASPSETMLLVVIKGAQDYYTVQWAEHAKSQPTPMALDTAKWQRRLAKLMPIHLCTKVVGETAPYPSCIERIGAAPRIGGHGTPAPTAHPPTGDAGLPGGFSEERDTAAGFAGTMNYLIGAMAATCRPLLDEAGDQPGKTVDTWRRQGKNDLFVRTAVHYEDALLEELEKTEGKQAMQRALAERVAIVQRDGEKSVRSMLDGSAQENTLSCSAFERAVQAGEFNLSETTPHYRTLQQMAADYGLSR
ncbi:MAG: hypothetical protein WA961_10515 [Rhodanobacter sp.]